MAPEAAVDGPVQGEFIPAASGPGAEGPWRTELLLVLAAAALLRLWCFVGFGLGDDLGYVGHAQAILKGGHPPLDPLNQYAYRPLLLLLFAGGIGLFGVTNAGVAAAPFLFSLVSVDERRHSRGARVLGGRAFPL